MVELLGIDRHLELALDLGRVAHHGHRAATQGFWKPWQVGIGMSAFGKHLLVALRDLLHQPRVAGKPGIAIDQLAEFIVGRGAVDLVEFRRVPEHRLGQSAAMHA